MQGLKNEINRLKGEKGQPEFKSKSVEVAQNRNISSESERKNSSKRKTERRKKRKELTIHETKIIELDKTKLPKDIEFRGYSERIIQGIKFEGYNILVKQAMYYSPSGKKTYKANSTSEYFKAEAF